jgi:hypothetical protein
MRNFLRILIAVILVVGWSFMVVPAITSNVAASVLLGMPAGAVAAMWVLYGWRA